ncbi:MAG: hypothetical protein HOV81_10090 [Kofleriaceae bacterium]|nr:hypothetical protein [Kofleriaceae bacterium]
MHRVLLLALLVSSPAFAEQEGDLSQVDVRAEIAPSGDTIKLATTTGGGKKSGVVLEAGKAKPTTLYQGEAASTLEVGHGKTVLALLVDDANGPFRVHVLDGSDAGKARVIARKGKRNDLPYAVAMTATPTGFTIFFQELEAQNANEAHTYMAELDKDGKPTGDAKEVAIPWALADVAWNGDGYQLALYYTADGSGARLSMVGLSKEGAPLQHPDWASQPGAITDVHLVASGERIHAYYRCGAGDRICDTDVTKIGQWGQVSTKARDIGAIGASEAIAITPKGSVKKVKR